MEEVNPITQFYFAMGIRKLERLLLGSKDDPRGRGEGEKKRKC